MQAIILTSTEPRHRYFVHVVAREFNIGCVLTQAKQNYYGQVKADSEVVRAHFDRLRYEESVHFGEMVEHRLVDSLEQTDDINEGQHIRRAMAEGPDVILLFGTSILSADWLEAFPGKVINLHLGLSPFYRGSATLFWPFYYEEIECVGTTIHLASEKVDAGHILSRLKPDLLPGDNYYTITMRLIKKSIDAVPKVSIDYLEGRIKPKAQEAAVDRRLCRKADFSEAALRKVLDYVGSGLGASEIQRIMESERCRCSQ